MANATRARLIHASGLEPNHPAVRAIRRAYLEVRAGQPPNYDQWREQHHAKNYERTRLACVESLAVNGKLPLWRGSERVPAWIELMLAGMHREMGAYYA